MYGILPILIFYFVFRFIMKAVAESKGKGRAGEKQGKARASEPVRTPPVRSRAVANPEPGRRAAAEPVRRPAAAAVEPVRRPMSGRAHRGDDCDYGDVNHEYSHDYQRRMEQLDSFLKNGIIDRAEYNVLKERYQQADHGG